MLPSQLSFSSHFVFVEGLRFLLVIPKYGYTVQLQLYRPSLMGQGPEIEERIIQDDLYIIYIMFRLTRLPSSFPTLHSLHYLDKTRDLKFSTLAATHSQEKEENTEEKIKNRGISSFDPPAVLERLEIVSCFSFQIINWERECVIS